MAKSGKGSGKIGSKSKKGPSGGFESMGKSAVTTAAGPQNKHKKSK
jgi:hypothetical protein